jgi:hypothetical protein
MRNKNTMKDFILKKILLIESTNNSNKLSRNYYGNNFQTALNEFNTKYRMNINITVDSYNKMFRQLCKDGYLEKSCNHCSNVWKIKD